VLTIKLNRACVYACARDQTIEKSFSSELYVFFYVYNDFSDV